MRIVQEESPGENYEIVEWAVHTKGFYDSSLLGKRRVHRTQVKNSNRKMMRYVDTIIYCSTEQDAEQLSANMTPKSKIVPVWGEKLKTISNGTLCY